MPMTWPEFINFFQMNFEDSSTFVDNIWKNIKRDSEY